MAAFAEFLTTLDKYLLTLLYSKNKEPIAGETWLQKEMFLIGKNVGQIGRDFGGYLKGPFSEAVEESVNQFEKSDFVTRNQGKISLTSNGVHLAEQIWISMSDEDKRMVEEMKDLLNDMTYQELLAFIYSTYPETTENSDIKEEVERLRLPAAISLVKKGKISVEKGAEVAGIPLLDFVEELKKRSIKRL
jgi:predicted HTH domain antitoxin